MNLLSIGTSEICDKFLAAIQQTALFNIYKTYSREQKSGTLFASKYAAIPVFGDLEHVLADPKIDAVYLASPTFKHYEHILLCLAHNKHIICEKPMVLSSKEYVEVMAIAKSKKLVVFEAMRTIHLPQLNTLKAWIAHKKINSVYLEFGKISSKYPEFLKGNIGSTFMPFSVGGGALYDLGIYSLNLAVALFGAPVATESQFDWLSNQSDGESQVVLKYDTFKVKCFQSKIKNYPCVSTIEMDNHEKITIESCSTLKTLKYFKDEQIQHALEYDGNDMIYEINSFYDYIHSPEYNNQDNHPNERITQAVYTIIENIQNQLIK